MNGLAKMLMLAAVAIGVTVAPAEAQKKKKNRELRRVDKEYFLTDDARRVGDQLLLFQRNTGGWPKNIDMTSPMTDGQKRAVLADKERRDDSTTDNGATTTQMVYLARLYAATGEAKYRDAFRRGVDYLLSGQYANGGWPQFWPVMRDYQIHITYNDHAMVNTMSLLRDIKEGVAPYDAPGLMPGEYQARLKDSFDRGVECILATQIVKDGEPTVWCQQHYRDTYAPAPARAYELPSYCSSESVSILRLLMEIPDPDARVKRAVHAGMRWLDDHKITGYRYEHGGWGNRNSRLVEDRESGPIWARFYDLEYGEPYVCDRDGVPRRKLEQIGTERRNGYGWYNSAAAELYPLYDAWADKWDAPHKLSLDLNSKGGNETGVMNLDREDA